MTAGRGHGPGMDDRKIDPESCPNVPKVCRFLGDVVRIDAGRDSVFILVSIRITVFFS